MLIFTLFLWRVYPKHWVKLSLEENHPLAQWVKNLTSIHENAGLIPGFNQCVKNLSLPQAAA